VHSKKAHSANVLSGWQQDGPAVANGSTFCEICDETPTDRVVSSCCGSAFCRSCVLDMMALENMQQDNEFRCVSCRRPFSIDLNQVQQQVVDDGTLTVSESSSNIGTPSLREMSHVASGSILRRMNLAEFATSTKVEALVQELVQMRKERIGSKALVFSQFVNMLDLVRWRLHSDPCLQDLGLGVRIIHGGMNIQSRDEVLTAFREDASVRVLLMSLKAGGVALNLTVRFFEKNSNYPYHMVS
jgi:DNA repair protein RAD16